MPLQYTGMADEQQALDDVQPRNMAGRRRHFVRSHIRVAPGKCGIRAGIARSQACQANVQITVNVADTEVPALEFQLHLRSMPFSQDGGTPLA
jgi:hypothetical protein